MKLTPGRMAHVKVENGCVEALLQTQVGDTAWTAVGLRAPGRDVENLHVEAARVHEPYGCMREIVLLPAAEPEKCASFGPALQKAGARPIDAVSNLSADPFAGAMEKLARGETFDMGSLTPRRYAACPPDCPQCKQVARKVGPVPAPDIRFVGPSPAAPPYIKTAEMVYGFSCACDYKGAAFISKEDMLAVVRTHIRAMDMEGDKREHFVNFTQEIRET